MFKKLVVCAAVMPLFVILVGCESSDSKPEAVGTQKHESNVAPGSGAVDAEQVFLNRCTSCHGMDGRGDGPGSAKLNPKPRNFHDKAWQASVTDTHIEKVIVYGGAAVGKSPQMAANPDFAGQPAVVTALRQYIRQLGKE
jgi:mono/diheme cytochrome c family protein